MTEILLEMLKMYGLKEVAGKGKNPEIIKMFHEIGFEWVQDDETSWCSAALNYFCKKLGYERSGALDAKSWLKMPIKVLQPSMGDIVVFWRETPDSWKGHVGLFITQDLTTVWCLGGNQGDMLCIKPYPRDHVIGYREVHKLPNP